MFTTFCARLAKFCMFVAVGGLVAIIVSVAGQVIGRYIFNDTPTWAEALALVLVLYVTMLGAAVGVRDAGHIGMESFLVLLPENIRLKIEYLIHVLVAFFGATMAWNTGILALSVMDYKIPTLGISEGVNYLPMVIAGSLILLFSVEHIIALALGREVEPAWH